MKWNASRVITLRHEIFDPLKTDSKACFHSASGTGAQGTQARHKVLGPTQIEVSFAPEWTAWLPMVWGAYWVLDLDADYQLAAVGEPSKSYLWILSRTPQVSAERYDAVLQRLNVMGFDITKLEKTRQN